MLIFIKIYKNQFDAITWATKYSRLYLNFPLAFYIKTSELKKKVLRTQDNSRLVVNKIKKKNLQINYSNYSNRVATKLITKPNKSFFFLKKKKQLISIIKTPLGMLYPTTVFKHKILQTQPTLFKRRSTKTDSIQKVVGVGKDNLVLGSSKKFNQFNVLVTNASLFKKKYFSFLNKFLVNFFNFLFQQHTHISFKKLWWQAHYLENKNSHKTVISKIRRYAKKLKAYKFVNNFYKLLWMSLKIKDSSFFLKWFIYRVELLFFKLHKHIPYLLNIILKQFSKRLFKSTNTKGLFFSMRGKISVTGDSKKRHVYVKYGKHTNTQKRIKVSFDKAQIKTKTGVVGVVFGIFF